MHHFPRASMKLLRTLSWRPSMSLALHRRMDLWHSNTRPLYRPSEEKVIPMIYIFLQQRLPIAIFILNEQKPC